MDWLVAATYCEEEYGISLNTKEGYFACPECGEPLLFEIGLSMIGKFVPSVILFFLINKLS